MQKVKLLIIIFIFPLLGIGCVCQDQKTPVDYVNAYIGNKFNPSEIAYIMI